VSDDLGIFAAVLDRIETASRPEPVRCQWRDRCEGDCDADADYDGDPYCELHRIAASHGGLSWVGPVRA